MPPENNNKLILDFLDKMKQSGYQVPSVSTGGRIRGTMSAGYLPGEGKIIFRDTNPDKSTISHEATHYLSNLAASKYYTHEDFGNMFNMNPFRLPPGTYENSNPVQVVTGEPGKFLPKSAVMISDLISSDDWNDKRFGRKPSKWEWLKQLSGGSRDALKNNLSEDELKLYDEWEKGIPKRGQEELNPISFNDFSERVFPEIHKFIEGKDVTEGSDTYGQVIRGIVKDEKMTEYLRNPEEIMARIVGQSHGSDPEQSLIGSVRGSVEDITDSTEKIGNHENILQIVSDINAYHKLKDTAEMLWQNIPDSELKTQSLGNIMGAMDELEIANKQNLVEQTKGFGPFKKKTGEYLWE